MLDNVLVDKLIDILDREAAVYEDILKISSNKTDVIVQGKVSELESMMKLEQALVLQMGRLENAREELIEKISAALSTDPSSMTITQLAALLDSKGAEKLKGCHKRLSGVLNELKAANELNSRLIKNSLEYIDFSINLMTSTSAAAGNNYGNSGAVADGGKRNLFDVKL